MEELSRQKNHKAFNEDVKKMQYRLNCVRYYVSGNWENLVQDGFFGSNTERAVKGFQSYAGLSSSGIYDNQTDHYLRNEEIIGKNSCKTYAPSSVPKSREYGVSARAHKVNDNKRDDSLVNTTAPEEVSVKKDFLDNVTEFFGMLKDTIFDLFKVLKKTAIEAVRSILRYGDNKSRVASLLRSLLKKCHSLFDVIQKKAVAFLFDHFPSGAPQAIKRLFASILYGVKNLNFTRMVNKFLSANDIGKTMSNFDKMTKIGKLKLTKAPGIGVIFSFKDFVMQLFKYGTMSDEQWIYKCKGFFFAALESVIIGVLVEAAVAFLVTAAVGTVISGGALTVLIAGVTAIVTILIGYLLSEYAGDDESAALHTFNLIVNS